MKGHIPGSTVEEVKGKADIVDVISEYVTLKKAGRNFVGLCPFHKEKTPSFSVNRDKQIFYCFGCGEGGNVISFLMKINHQSFPEAVRYLARKTGTVIPQGVMTPEEKERFSLKEQVNRVNKMAVRHFSQNLFSPAGAEAREYLAKREIRDSVIREYHLGCALDGWRHLRDFLEKGKVPLKLAEQAGLIILKVDKGESFYDRFRGRLIFPIEDIGGNVVAFGGRIIGEGEPKYLNSPESPVYVKGRCLYGLNRTKDDIRQKGFAIVVEGYFDLLSLWNAGVTNVVATLGTALTKDHVDLIRRYTGHVIVVFDPDEAGKKALERSLSLFLAGSINAKVVVLPDEHDPDQYVRTFGKEAFDELVAHAQSMVDYYIEKVIGKVGTLEDKMASVRNAVPFIVNIGDAIERNLFIKRVSEKLGIDEGLLKKEVHRSSAAPSAVSADGRGMEDKGKIDRIELSLIHIMLEYPRKIPEMVRAEILNYLTNADLRKFLEDIKAAFDKHDEVAFDATLLVNHMNNDTIRQKLLKKMMDEAPYDEQMADCVLNDAIRQIKKKWYREKHRILKMKLVKAEEKADQELCNSLLSEKEKLLREEEASSS